MTPLPPKPYSMLLGYLSKRFFAIKKARTSPRSGMNMVLWDSVCQQSNLLMETSPFV